METTNGGEGFDELVARGADDLEQANALIPSSPLDEREKLEYWCGSLLQPMLKDRIETSQSLSHQDPLVRIGALTLLRNYWEVAPETARFAERLLLHDPDPRVRGVAIMTLLRARRYASEKSIELAMAIVKARKMDLPRRQSKVGQYEGIARGIAKKSERRRLQLWEALAGSALGKLLSSRDKTQEALKDNDPKLRMAALLLLCDHWPRDAELSKLCEKMAFGDSDPEVRAFAFGQAGALSKGTGDARMGKMLARVVHDHQEPANVRRAAYRALFQVRGLPLFSLYKAGVLSKDAKFPEDCDWAFVDSFLT
jgi:hypothetical protein